MNRLALIPIFLIAAGGAQAGVKVTGAGVTSKAPVAAVPATAAAAAKTSDTKMTPAIIDPVFDCTSSNSAWGMAYSGKVIDRQGKVWQYGQKGKALPTATKEQDHAYFSAADLHGKYSGAAAGGSSVDAKTLAEKSALIDKAAASKLTHSDTGTRDAGTSICHAYVYDAAKQRYRDVELGSDGGAADSRSVNDAPEAKALIDWLKSVGVAK